MIVSSRPGPLGLPSALRNVALLLLWFVGTAINISAAGGQEVIQDNHFREGFVLWDPKPGKHVKYGQIPGLKSESKPVWGLSQWSSKFPIRPPERRAAETPLLFTNRAKSITLLPANADLALAVNSAIEYGPHSRKAGEPWVHLLVEQEFENPPFLQTLSAAKFHLEARLLRSTNLHRGDYDPGVHAAQFQVFFAVQNRNRQSAGYGDYLWFGIPVYDNRHPHPPEFKSKDFGGTEKFIFTPAGSTFTATSAHDRDWIQIDRDLLPLMREAVEVAWAKGFLAASKDFADYAIGGMNMGWELPGMFDVAIEIRNLSLLAVQSEKEAAKSEPPL